MSRDIQRALLVVSLGLLCSASCDQAPGHAIESAEVSSDRSLLDAPEQPPADEWICRSGEVEAPRVQFTWDELEGTDGVWTSEEHVLTLAATNLTAEVYRVEPQLRILVGGDEQLITVEASSLEPDATERWSVDLRAVTASLTALATPANLRVRARVLHGGGERYWGRAYAPHLNLHAERQADGSELLYVYDDVALRERFFAGALGRWRAGEDGTLDAAEPVTPSAVLVAHIEALGREGR